MWTRWKILMRPDMILLLLWSSVNGRQGPGELTRALIDGRQRSIVRRPHEWGISVQTKYYCISVSSQLYKGWTGKVRGNIFTCNLYSKCFRRDKNSSAPCPGPVNTGSIEGSGHATLYQLPKDNIWKTNNRRVSQLFYIFFYVVPFTEHPVLFFWWFLLHLSTSIEFILWLYYIASVVPTD